MQPLKIGAALTLASLPAHRDWLFEADRDLEMQDFVSSKLLLGDWRSHANAVKDALDGFGGRLGIHGPFWHLPLDCDDPEFQPLITKRYLTGIDICAILGARQMVIHSPYTTWNHFNRFNYAPVDPSKTAADEKIEKVHGVLGDVVKRAEEEGVTLVIENIEDVDPRDRRHLVDSFDSANVRLSIDTGHAHYAHGSTGAPPVDYFVADAGAQLGHVHLQDADGNADRHWAPGQGNILWPAVFGALARLPRMGTDQAPHLVLELRNHDDVPAGFQHLKDAGLAI
ncbi:MAG: sugar phosphate isomerase/epimerase [Devosiaceae bacterium]|nr:sugar phosphate isomerase/epimerase [Devosiaceae bacterium MH13]